MVSRDLKEGISFTAGVNRVTYIKGISKILVTTFRKIV